MPTIAENLQSWNVHYPWPRQGEEWSQAWGGSEAQWFGTILPRIQAFLPARRVLEIGPGFGRWTHYLRGHCEGLVGVDLAQKCVDACRARFAGDDRLAFHANDGTSLDMVADGSIDFVFSFDTLVHAEREVLDAYLPQLARKLAPGGRGFVHHSNLGAYREITETDHWRARSMTAEAFRRICAGAGLCCISQELVTWGTKSMLIDCFSIFGRAHDAPAEPTRVVENPDFMREAELAKRRAATYSTAVLRS